MKSKQMVCSGRDVQRLGLDTKRVRSKMTVAGSQG
jgi:hypothetical protein